MKKIFLSLLMVGAGCAMASAQYDYSSAARLDSIESALSNANARMAEMKADSTHTSIWSRTTSANIGYSAESTSTDLYERQKAKFGVFFNFNHSYLFPKSKAWGNMVKVGLNVRWFDLDFAMYDDFARPAKTTGNNNYYNPYAGYDGLVSDLEGNSNTTDNIAESSTYYAKFKQMTLLAGLCGVGPVVTVAPLSFMNNAASGLKVHLYFHYQPTLGINFYQMGVVRANAGQNPLNGTEMGNKDMSVELGYVSMMDFGFRVTWRNYGLGVEGRWGSGKLKNTTYTPYAGGSPYFSTINVNGAPDPDGNYTRKFGETRVFLDFAF